MDFHGRTIVVTGGATGMGRAGVELFRERGAEVALIDWNEPVARQAAAATGAHAFIADVSDEAQVKRAFEAIDGGLGPIHGLWSNAGIQRVEAPLHEESSAVWDETINVNLRGTFLVVREAMKRFVAQGGPAAVVCTSSIYGRLAIPGGANAYAATKGAIEAFVRQVSLDYAGRRIRVNAVAPGAIDTPLMWGTTPDDQVEEMRRIIDSEVPLGKIGMPVDIAYCAAWLLSDEAAYVTGQAFVVDGGVGARMILSV